MFQFYFPTILLSKTQILSLFSWIILYHSNFAVLSRCYQLHHLDIPLQLFINSPIKLRVSPAIWRKYTIFCDRKTSIETSHHRGLPFFFTEKSMGKCKKNSRIASIGRTPYFMIGTPYWMVRFAENQHPYPPFTKRTLVGLPIWWSIIYNPGTGGSSISISG